MWYWMLNNLHKATLNQRLHVCRRWSYSPLINFCLNQAPKTCRSLTSIMTCRSAMSCTPVLHRMMTVPVASRPLLPALPAIWMYSPVQKIKEASISCCAARLWFPIKENNQREDQTWQQIPETGAVVFSDAVKHDGPGRHVHPHGERLCSKQHLREEGRQGFAVFKCHSRWRLN